MLIQENLNLQQKLEILTDAAKYDVACTSSGVNRQGRPGTIGNTAASGICHSFAADGRCISLLKILMTNACVYDCKYCVNRSSNDTVRTFFTPEEICTLTMEFYRRNYIEGLFLSSGIFHSPNETMEHIYQTLRLLREVHRFWGYIHVKAIPGADPVLIQMTGHLADRMSVNLELPTVEGLRTLAPSKTREKILKPMRQIQNGIRSNTLTVCDPASSAAGKRQNTRTGEDFALPAKAAENKISSLSPKNTEVKESVLHVEAAAIPALDNKSTLLPQEGSHFSSLSGSFLTNTPDEPISCFSGMQSPAAYEPVSYEKTSRFVPAGQSTQMIIGATPETDHQILSVTEALYRQFDLKRVFFSAYTALNDDSSLPSPGTPPPLLREHRLYQADWLLRFYGFRADELLTEDKPFFNLLIDPKCDWALRHLEFFPVEVTKAPYATLLRVPGVGVKSARRIVAARRYGTLDFGALKKFGVVLKRAAYFITCGGKMLHTIRLEESFLIDRLADADKKNRLKIEDSLHSFRQLSLFDDFHLHAPPSREDFFKSVSGQM